MALAFNGTSGFLEYASSLVSSYPCTLMVWGTRTSSGGDQYWISQSQSNGDRYISGWHLDSSDTKYISARIAGGGDSQAKNTAPHTSSSVFGLMVLVFASPSSKTIYFGDSTGLTNTVSAADQLANHDRCVIGARHYSSAAASLFANGSLAEAHWFNTALTSTDVANLIADTVKPEALSGWVDGWTLKDYQASGNYVSIGGTRTMVATGGVAASGLNHPVSRTVPGATINLTGTSTTQSATSSTGAATVTAPVAGVVNLAGSNSTQGATSSTAAATVTQPVGTITTEPFKNWSNQVQANLTVPNVVVLKMDRSVALSLANQTTNGSGVLTIANAALTTGTSYMLATFNADGSARGFKKYAAA
jgi:hypothetical protein